MGAGVFNTRWQRAGGRLPSLAGVLLAGTLLTGTLLAASGCGYVLVGSDGLPAEVRSIHVRPVKVGDGDPHLADALARELRTILRSRGRYRVADTPGGADAVLAVEIRRDSRRAVAFDRFDRVLDYQTTLAADAALTGIDGTPIWHHEGVSSSRGHAAVAGAVLRSSATFQRSDPIRAERLADFDTVQLGEARESAARGRLVQDLAKAIYGLMTEPR